MDTTKPPGPTRKVLIGSAVVLTAVLVGAAYFLGDFSSGTVDGPSPVASTFQPLLERCDGEPANEPHEGGGVRTSCVSRAVPAFVFYAVAKDDALREAAIMVSLDGPEEALEARKLVGLELFSLAADAEAASFLPPEQLQQIGIANTRFVRDGMVYVTESVGEVGLVFSAATEQAWADRVDRVD